MYREGFAIIITAALACVGLGSCNRKMVYDKYVNTPVAGWEKNDPIAYALPRIDSSGVYEASVGLRTTDAYPFMSITLIVQKKFVEKDSVATDTVRCQLTDQKGNAVGKGIIYHQYRFPVSEFALSNGDSIVVSIRHDMKREILPGISDVGLILKRK